MTEGGTLHCKITASYPQVSGTTYEVGICFPMHAPYDDTMDCMTTSKDSGAKDSVVLIEADGDDKGMADYGDYPEDTLSQSWESEGGNAAETCLNNVCQLTYSFKRGFETDVEVRKYDNTAPVEDY